MNKIFKNEKNPLYKLEAFFWKCYSKEPLRFIFWGGINSLITIINSIWIRLIFEHFGYSKTGYSESASMIEILVSKICDWPFIIAFIIGIPIAYTTHALFSFHQKWSFVRLLRYPLSSIPNFLLQSFAIWLFEIVCHMHWALVYVLAAVFPLPIMFFVNKFLVSPIKKRGKSNKETDTEDNGKKTEENKEESDNDTTNLD